MENAALKHVTNSNFNNMTDEQLHDWPLSFLSEAQRENYVNQNLEIVRHYRTEALSRAPAFNIERNAIDAAIARHGLYMSNGAGTAGGAGAGVGAGTAAEPAAEPEPEEEAQPPPVRRQRLLEQQQQQPEQRIRTGSNATATATATTSNANGNGHYVALAHIFSEAYAIRMEPPSNGSDTAINSNNNGIEPVAELSETVMKETIDSLGLRRT